MHLTTIKTSLYFIITFIFIIMSLVINDAVNSQLLASLSIISGAYANKSLSANNNAE